MQIRDTHHQTLDDYSIEDVQVRYDRSVEPPGFYTYLSVSLKPEVYARSRFEGVSYETKKQGARELIIQHRELQKMVGALVGALRDELHLCYQVLSDHDLLTKLREAKRNRKPQAPIEQQARS
jgi:hypothetical protein